MSSLNLRKKQLPPNNWSCLLYATSLVSGYVDSVIIKFVGHDGSEIIDPNLPEPLKRRGFLPHEMIAFLWSKNFAPVSFYNHQIMLCDNKEIIVENQHFGQSFNQAMKIFDCILIVPKEQYEHAYAWFNLTEKLIDPSSMSEIDLSQGIKPSMVIVLVPLN